MVRMTDLLKKARGQMEGEKKPTAAPKKEVVREEPVKAKPPVEKPIKPPVPEEKKPAAVGPVEFSGLLAEAEGEKPIAGKGDVTHEFMRASIPDEKETKKLYNEAIEFVKNIFDAYKKGKEINQEEVTNICHKIINNIFAGPRALLKIFHESDSLELHRHYNAVNVSILSVEMGIIYKYNKSILLDLAVVGLLHDLELIKNEELIKKPAKLNQEEFMEIKKHPVNLAAFVDRAFNFKDEMVKGILQHHERRNGKGYPSGLTDRDIHDFAVIISIADTYEAMIHSRPYKTEMVPHEAVMNIIAIGKKLFPNEAVKALVACVGLYPVGSWVELNTGEIGKVLAANADSPLRPVVNILMDKERNKLEEPRTTDLQRMPSLYIKQAVKNVEI